ncbi:MAG: hypothetical protein EAZ53_06155 [Bacteroidetes bacterium]|nr:MAG: hypothetical protein EAZ53_06155 [Bacteroidota bacterium]
MTSSTQNKSTALVISMFIHLILILFLFFFVLKTPNPPFGGGQGVVLNLGYVDEGSGEVQTLNPASDNPNTEEIKPNDNPLETPNQEQQTPDNQNNSSENLVTSTEESTIKTEPNANEGIEKTEIIKKTEPKEIKPNQIIEKTNIETKNTEKTTNSGSQTNGTATEGGNNNGDKTGKIGDQGNPNGDINAKALYGNPGEGGDGKGGKGGAALDMAGWKWEKLPKIKDDNEDENGKLVFQITIDEQGEIISIKTLEKTVSPAVEKLYKQEVEKLTFSKTDGKIPPTTSTGKITFIIKSK